jgi:hypothetical protein
MSGRKIVHIDMDAFYASVEQRDKACEAARVEPAVDGMLYERQIDRSEDLPVVGGSEDCDRHLRNLILG